MSIDIDEIETIQNVFSELVNLIENTTNAFKKHFSQMVVLYESSDPASSIITNEALAEFKQTKSDIIKHISGLALVKELKVYEKLKLSFKLANLIDTFQSPIRQMRDALDNARIKESITSSDNSHLTKTVEMLHMIFNNYNSKSYKLQQSCYDSLLHLIITETLNTDELDELNKKYPSITFYSALLSYAFKHFKNTNLIENVEILKDRLLNSTQTISKNPFTFQMYDLIGSKYMTIKEIFGSDADFEKIAKRLSIDDKQFDIIVITSYTEYIYDIWTLFDEIEYDCIDVSVVDQFKTIRPVQSKVKTGIKIYTSKTKSKANIKKYYYVLETYDNVHYRVLTPWQVFPNTGTQYIPQSWLPNFGEKQNYPSGRIEAYNQIVESQILKHKGIEKESKVKPVEVSKERGLIVDKLYTWFLDNIKKNTPENLGQYRDLINGDEFRDYIETVIVSLLIEKYESSLTVHSTASVLTRRISREILGIITKSTNLKNLFEQYPDKIAIELPGIFKTQIQQCIDIVVSYNSLLSPIDKMLELDL